METMKGRAVLPKTGGMLLSAVREGRTEAICWAEVTVGDLVITVASDAMKASAGGRDGVRLPVSYAETVIICRELECVAPTQAMADAMFAQAAAQLTLVPLVRTAADSAKMTTVEFTLKFHDGVEKQLARIGAAAGALVAGAWKYWLLHRRLVERGAVNYGFWDKSRKPPKPVQTVGGMHDASHYDYSQLLQPVKRLARSASTGEEIDLLDWIAKNEKVPARFLDVYEADAGDTVKEATPRPVAVVVPVDLAATLGNAGVSVAAVADYKTRGRAGFAPIGIMVHHTAGPKKGEAPSLNVCIHGRAATATAPALPGPLCNVLLGRTGIAHVVANKVANHAGQGVHAILDLVRHDQGVTANAKVAGEKTPDANPFFYGIEIENMGVASDPYPAAQIEALVKICATICSAHGWSARRVIHHRQWTSRKIDMSYRGDLPSLVAQQMDAGVVRFADMKERTAPMFEPEPAHGRARQAKVAVPGESPEVEKSLGKKPKQKTTAKQRSGKAAKVVAKKSGATAKQKAEKAAKKSGATAKQRAAPRRAAQA